MAIYPWHGGDDDKFVQAPQAESPTNMGLSDEQLRARLELLRMEHRDLDEAIAALAESAAQDQLRMARLKKRKLLLRDHIRSLEGQLIPDIIA